MHSAVLFKGGKSYASIIAVLALVFAATAHADKIKTVEIIELGAVQDQNWLKWRSSSQPSSS